MQPKIKNATFATQCHPYQNMRYHSKKNLNFDTKLRFFFYPQKTLNKGISQKKEKFLRDFIYVYWEEVLPQDTFSQFTIKLISVNKCTAFDLKKRQNRCIIFRGKVSE